MISRKPQLQLQLNPSAVRERSKAISTCHEVPAQGQNIVSFLVEEEQSAARVNIFCDTGTIGTSRVLQGGVVRQSFRRNVTSLDVVEKLLRYPEGPTQINETLIGLTDDDDDSQENRGDVATRLSSPTTVQKELELADVGLAILQGEREKLEKHLHQLEQQQETPVETKPVAASTFSPSSLLGSLQISPRSNGSKSPTKRSSASNVPSPKQASKPSPTKQQQQQKQLDDDKSSVSSAVSSSHQSEVTNNVTVEFQFQLPTDVMKQVDQCLRDISKMDKVVKGVATNGKGTVFLYGNGGVAYTPSIPKALYQKLRQLRSSSFASRPCLGPNALDKILKKQLASAKLPRSVAFGSTYDTFFIVFEDGSWQYQGRGIPQTLEEKLASRDDRADLVTVNLGPSGEWFLKAENGRMWWSGITQDLDGVLAKILKEGYLHSMDFGENGSYFVTYEQE
ncbi:MAG: hypothetical protein SGARI_000315 [Bacillariaceae sp.]